MTLFSRRPVESRSGPALWRGTASLWLTQTKENAAEAAASVKSVFQLVAGLEHPVDDSQAQQHESDRHAYAQHHVHIRLAVEAPAEAVDQIHHRVEQRDLLPGLRQHR